jgi:hypothetical protein
MGLLCLPPGQGRPARLSGSADADSLQQLGRGDREPERRLDALMLRCKEAEVSDANHARH